MAMQEITVRFPPEVMRALEQIALQKKINRAQVISQIVQESLSREQVRAQALAEWERKRASPEWHKATKRLAEFRKHIKPIPESELEDEIQEAITAVRARKNKSLKSEA